MIVHIAQHGREACHNPLALDCLFSAARVSPKLRSNIEQKPGEDYHLMSPRKSADEDDDDDGMIQPIVSS